MPDDKNARDQPGAEAGDTGGRAADVPTRPSRPGTADHQRRAHEAAAAEQRQRDRETADRPTGEGQGDGRRPAGG